MHADNESNLLKFKKKNQLLIVIFIFIVKYIEMSKNKYIDSSGCWECQLELPNVYFL